MSVLRLFIKLAVVIACTGGSFGGVVGFMAARSEALPLNSRNAGPVAVKLAEDSDLAGAPLRAMSPIYPTIRYTQAQLAQPIAKKSTAKVTKISATKKPLQLAAYKNL